MQSVTGREPEQYLAFAGLRQLLLPVLDRVADLPGRQTLLEALALSTATVQPDALLTGIAVLTVLSELAEDHPLLVSPTTHSGWTAAHSTRSPSPHGALNQSSSC